MIDRILRGRVRSGPRTKRVHTGLRIEFLEDRALMAAGLAPQLLLTMRSGGYQTVRVDAGTSTGEALAACQASPNVQAAEVDQQVSISVVPNDPKFGSMWDLRNTGQSGGTVDADIDADQAWDLQQGSLRTTVAIIDTGIDYTHPDLYKNIWLNQGELPTDVGLVDTDGDGLITFWDLNTTADTGKVTDINGNGRIDGYDVLHDPRWANGQDNDHDGKVDDLIGWDFVNNDNDPFDDNGHGTHVSGTIGALGDNGVGVVGINWKVELVGLKFLDASGSGYTSAAVAALNYAVSKGIKISNNSWGGGGYSSAMASAISNARAAGHVFVAAAGNDASNNDTRASYPSNYNYDNVVAVASTDRNDRLSSFSNYGATTVDLAAPGSSILSTTPNNTYSIYSGTSMATPHVTGAVALAWSAEPTLSYSQVIARIKSSVDPLASLAGRVASGGRLNVYKALLAGGPDTTGPQVTSAVPDGTSSVSSVRVTFSEPIDPATFTLIDISNFTGPQGAVAVTGVQAVAGSNDTQFDIVFAQQTTVGAYQFDLGPTISDLAGNPMNQNGNAVNGETGDLYHVAFSISSSPSGTFTNSTPAPILDYTTTASTITISQNLSIKDLNVKLNISHTYDGDLYVYLVGPGGTRVDLVRYRGGSGDDFTNTTFDDEAKTAIRKGRAPFSGTYKPEQSLSAFDRKNAQGTWTLYVYDRAYLDDGTLNWWSLVVSDTGALASGTRPAPAEAARTVDAVGWFPLVGTAPRRTEEAARLAALLALASPAGQPVAAVVPAVSLPASPSAPLARPLRVSPTSLLAARAARDCVFQQRPTALLDSLALFG